MRPKDVSHSGKPHKSVIPKSAMFLMANEDRGSEDDTDPTDGGQESNGTPDGTMPAEVMDSIRQLVSQYGPEKLHECVDMCSGDSEMSGEGEETGEVPNSPGEDEENAKLGY